MGPRSFNAGEVLSVLIVEGAAVFDLKEETPHRPSPYHFGAKTKVRAQGSAAAEKHRNQTGSVDQDGRNRDNLR
jgi:hypothetical protein